MLLKFKILKVFFIVVFITNANAITYDNIEVSEQYGKLTSHEQACGIARDSLFDKARRMASGYETISSGLQKTIKWYKENLNHYSDNYKNFNI